AVARRDRPPFKLLRLAITWGPVRGRFRRIELEPSPRLAASRSPRLPQRECDEGVTLLFFPDLRVPARGDDDELLAAGRQLIRHRGGVAGRRQRALPELASGLDVERAQVRIERPGDEDDAAGRGDG